MRGFKLIYMGGRDEDISLGFESRLCSTFCLFAVRFAAMNGGSANVPRGVNLPAIGYMSAAVLIFSLVPLVIVEVDGAENPFLFNAGWRLGASVGCVLVLLVFWRPLILDRGVLLFSLRRTVSWAIFWGAVGCFDYGFFTWSTRFIDVSVSAILFELWPIPFILIVSRFLGDAYGYSRNLPVIVPLMAVAFVGLVLVVASQTGSFGGIGNIGFPEGMQGVVLAIVAALLGSLGACSLIWGRNLADQLAGMGVTHRDRSSLVLFGAILGFGISSFWGATANAAVGLLYAGRPSFEVFSVGVIVGVLLQASAAILQRKANLSTRNLGVNALGYAIPILSLIWLWIFSEINVLRPDYLILGAAAIVTANLLINFDAEIRWGFKALILALGTCGAAVYLRDGVFADLGIADWSWAGSGYFESIALAATVFTLLLAFRVARLVSRTSEEDNQTFAVYRKLDILARRGTVDPEVCRHILDMDSARNNSTAEKEAYEKARQLIADVDPKPLKEADIQLLSDAESGLDALARSKQVDIHYGEMFALGIFATMTIVLAVFSRPSQVEGWTRLMVDLFAMVISAIVIFLLVHVYDLQQERDGAKFETVEARPAYRYYLVRFLDTKRRSSDQWFSFIIGGAIVLTYAGLLARKWLGSVDISP